MVIGALLLGAELFVIEAEFFLVFVGISALLVGALTMLVPGIPLWGHWLIFAGVALGSMVLFRRRVYSALRRQAPGLREDFLGDEIRLAQTLPPGESCRMELRGSTWEIRNAGSAPIPAGGRATVIAIEGLVLRVAGVQGASSTGVSS
jgi:membrane protein implicated in regulation of membrane protease activity